MPSAGTFLCFDSKIHLHLTYDSPDANALREKYWGFLEPLGLNGRDDQIC